MEQLIQQLKVILGTNFGLYFKSHSFHWNIEGADFVQYHTYLDGFYNAVWANTDIIAEKVRMLSAFAPTGLSRMIELSAVEESEGIPSALSMIAELKSDNDKMITQIKAGIVLADQENEPAISNFLQDLLDQHQKHAWFLRSITK
jgi:starvation-inducible DNA-binding protein